MTKQHDVVVVGAGPGGSSTAHFLAQGGLDVLLLDKSDFPRDKTCGDGLTPRALGVIDELGLLPELNAAGCRMEHATVFSPSGRPVTTRMPVRDGLPDYMLAVPRLILDDAIRQRALASGVTFASPVHVTDLHPRDDGVEVQGRQGAQPYQARARAAVIAVGASVPLLLRLGLLAEMPPMVLAARTYYEGMQDLSGHFEFHFDGVPLPGYGWIFPLSATSANVGAGIVMKRSGQRGPSARQILARFLETPFMRHSLAEARAIGPVKGFPLRTDFATAPTVGPRMLLVGEAAGLVNPLTGEGIDYALESGKIAARHLLEACAADNFRPERLAAYDRQLRRQFQRMFHFCTLIRDWYLHRPVLNRLVYVANRRASLRRLFTDIVLGNEDAARAVSWQTLAQVVFTL